MTVQQYKARKIYAKNDNTSVRTYEISRLSTDSSVNSDGEIIQEYQCLCRMTRVDNKLLLLMKNDSNSFFYTTYFKYDYKTNAEFKKALKLLIKWFKYFYDKLAFNDDLDYHTITASIQRVLQDKKHRIKEEKYIKLMNNENTSQTYFCDKRHDYNYLKQINPKIYI